MGFLLTGLAILPWVLYNDPIKIVVSSVIGFKKPERSIFGGGTDWLEPRQRIDLWSLVVTIFTNICVSVVTKFIVLVLLGIYVLWIIVSKRYRIERIYFGLALLANYIMVILGTIYLIPGVLSDYGSVERRLMFLIPLLTYILILLISDIKTNLLLKYLLLGFMGVSICVQFWLCRFWLKEQLPSSVFVINVDVKKEYSADVDAILKTLKNKKDKRIYIIDAYSTGDLVLNYYLKNKRVVRHSSVF